MIVYYFVLVLLPLALVTNLARSRDASRVMLAITALATIMISGMRWASDVDHIDYADMFTETPNLANFNPESIRDLHGEVGYLLLSAIFKSLGLNFVTLSFACAAFSVGIKAFVSSRFSRSASLAFCLYLCVHFITIEFIQIRWAVASALIMLAIHYQYHRKLVVAAALLVLAVGFHYFSVLFVFVCVLAEVRKETIYYLVVVSASLVGLILAVEGFVYTEVNESELYVIKRLFSYISDPLSNVGLLSYAKIALFPFVYFVLTKLYPALAVEPVTMFLRRIAFASIAATLLVSFIPLMHFRAVVLADIFSLLLLLRMLDRCGNQVIRVAILSAFSTLYSVWYVIDIANYIDAGRLYVYRTWLQMFI